MSPTDTHDWIPIDPGSKYFKCRTKGCPVSGKQVGGAWPPIRDPKFILPAWRSCEGAKQAAVDDYIKRNGG